MMVWPDTPLKAIRAKLGLDEKAGVARIMAAYDAQLFKASWERMVLLATMAQIQDQTGGAVCGLANSVIAAAWLSSRERA